MTELDKNYKLAESAKQMFSHDYKERLKAEYVQISIRTNNLMDTISHRREKFTPLQLDLIQEQLKGMIAYKNALEMRLTIENIDISF